MQQVGSRHEPFFGRDREILKLAELVRTSQFVSVHGDPGIGKSSLAWRMAFQLEDELDGRVFRVVVRANTSEAGLIRDIANAFGVPTSDVGLGEMADLERISTVPALLILDQCDRAIEVSRQVVAQVVRSCPFLMLITTSRWPIATEDGSAFRLEGLTSPAAGEKLSNQEVIDYDAVKLFVDRLGQFHKSLELVPKEIDQVRDLCEWFQGNPAAIRLSAATAALLGLEVVHCEMQLRLQQGASSRSALEVSISSAYEALDEETAGIARLLSVLCSDWTLAAAAAISEASDLLLVRKALETLSNGGLLELRVTGSGQVRFRFSDTVQAFLLSSLSEGERLAAEYSHARYYVTIASEIEEAISTSDVSSAMDQAELEYLNLRLAAERMVERRDPLGLKLITSIALYCQRVRPVEEGRSICLAAAELAIGSDPSTEGAKTLNSAAAFCLMTGSHAEAEEFGTRASAMAEKMGDSVCVASAQSNIAWARKCSDDLEGAALAAVRAVEKLRGTTERRRLVAALNNAGSIHEDLEEYDLSRACFRECISIADSIGDKWSAMRARSNLAELYLHEGDIDNALAGFCCCLQEALDLGDDVTVALSIEGAAFSLIEAGDLKVAANFLFSAERFREDRVLPASPHQQGFVAAAWKEAARGSSALAGEKYSELSPEEIVAVLASRLRKFAS